MSSSSPDLPNRKFLGKEFQSRSFPGARRRAGATNSTFNYTSLRDLMPSVSGNIRIDTESTSTYTSLKDLMPSVNGNLGIITCSDDIPISNNLVQKAAWTYLQPMMTSSKPIIVRKKRFLLLCRVWNKLKPQVHAYLRFIKRLTCCDN
ncbi:hypothetical protein O6P43_000504 [Quillaja saponaria]|uniref:Uncharacterized protein n=1 Tax=Quillaja saponaria TaxID=32244 RepID=A0AAD7QGS9_QUISA|nr:hypothetical protein O6P43_000504 [Quillaja saponaria]